MAILRKFESGATYRLINKQGFIDANIANLNLANEIVSTGGTIRPLKVIDGNAVGVAYLDGSTNSWAGIWANEARFFVKVPDDAVSTLGAQYPNSPLSEAQKAQAIILDFPGKYGEPQFEPEFRTGYLARPRLAA